MLQCSYSSLGVIHMKASIELLKTLTDVNGIGQEMQVKKTMRDYLNPISDSIIEDHLGGILVKLRMELSRLC